MKVYFVLFDTNWGEKGVWGTSSTPAKAIELAEAFLVRQQWPEPRFLSLQEKGQVMFREELYGK